MGPRLTHSVILHRPVAGAGPSDARTRRLWERLPTRASLVSSGGGEVTIEGLQEPEQTRTYILRHRGDLTAKWLLEHDGLTYAIRVVAPAIGMGRRRYVRVICAAVPTDAPAPPEPAPVAGDVYALAIAGPPPAPVGRRLYDVTGVAPVRLDDPGDGDAVERTVRPTAAGQRIVLLLPAAMPPPDALRTGDGAGGWSFDQLGAFVRTRARLTGAADTTRAPDDYAAYVGPPLAYADPVTVELRWGAIPARATADGTLYAGLYTARPIDALAMTVHTATATATATAVGRGSRTVVQTVAPGDDASGRYVILAPTDGLPPLAAIRTVAADGARSPDQIGAFDRYDIPIYADAEGQWDGSVWVSEHPLALAAPPTIEVTWGDAP